MRRLLIFALTLFWLLPLTQISHAQSGSHRVYYLTDDNQIVALDPLTGTRTSLLILDAAPDALGLYPSPDGQYLAVFARLGSAYQLDVVETASGTLLLGQPLLPDGFSAPTEATLGDPRYELTRALGELAWSPDSSTLAYVSGAAGSADIYTFIPAQQQNVRLTDLESTTAAFIHWSPDSMQFLFTDLVSFGDGSGYDISGYYRVSPGQVERLNLDDTAPQGIAIIGWLSANEILYSAFDFTVGAAGLHRLDLSTQNRTQILPARIPLAIPAYAPAIQTSVIVVPPLSQGGLVPGLYTWQGDAAPPSLLQTGEFYSVQHIRAGLFQVESAGGSLLFDATTNALTPLPANSFGAFVSPVMDIVVLAREDGTYVSPLYQDAAQLIWMEESQIPIWSPEGNLFYSYGFTGEGAGLVAVDVAGQRVILLDTSMSINSPRAVSP